MTIYKGWIPTVSGRLSFDVIGTGSHPNTPSPMNVADARLRYVLCRQERILLDNALPFREIAARKLYKELGRFQFVCLGTSSNYIEDVDDSLQGTLYIFEPMVWNEVIGDKFSSAQSYLLKYWKELPIEPIQSYFHSKYQELALLLTDHCAYCVQFSLSRSGITTIIAGSSFDETHGTPKIAKDEDPHIEHTLCAQLFFSLRDIVHNHQHHDPFTDTISDLYMVQNEKDEFVWRCDALRLLYRMILNYKRNRKEGVCNSALGMIAYSKSLRSISDNDLQSNSYYKKAGSRLYPAVNDDLLQDSIRASQDSLRSYLQEKIRKADKLTNIFLGFLTVILSIVGMLQVTKISYDEDDVSIFYHFLSWSIMTQPLLCISGLIVVGYYLAERWEVFQFKKRVNVYRVIVTQDQNRADIGIRIIAAIVFVITVILCFSLDDIAVAALDLFKKLM